ncbi:uncharacterized protein LOC110725388 [Chenopodium quinoa]|uniref:uncharacterized protein LOC110725388 n=1 Tax=Chenopodium quinoa TaxID=63459 RepID=UPI000B776E2E|nr:uncharacterized protein LOC110725388 [Chenopodium quinoa]
MIGKGCNLDEYHRAWVIIWGMEASPKVRHFFWRFCSNILPTKALLKHRHLLEDASCPWCGNEEETSNHAIFDCIRVKDLWEESGCSSLICDSRGSACDMVERWRSQDAKKMQTAAFLAWLIWNERNNYVFSGNTTPHNVLMRRLRRLVEDYGAYAKKIYGIARPAAKHSPSKWLPPSNSVIKLNADASLVD